MGRQCSLPVPSLPLLFACLAHVDTLNLISFLSYEQRVLPWAHGAVVSGYPSWPQWPQCTFGCIVPSAVLSVLPSFPRKFIHLSAFVWPHGSLHFALWYLMGTFSKACIYALWHTVSGGAILSLQ